MDVTNAAREFLRTQGSDRFFLYLHYMDVHQYLSDEESARFGTAYSDLYDNSIHWTDRHVNALFNALEEAGIYNRIVGRDGIDLEEKYANGIRTLLGVHSHGFPNLFIMGGYQASFKFNLTDVLHAQGVHIAHCIDYARGSRQETIDVTAESEEWWVREVIDNRGTTNRSAECTPGYDNFEGEEQRRQDGNYNAPCFRYLDRIAEVDAKLERHFSFEPA